MTSVTTDYTRAARSDSLVPGAFTSYRFTHWLIDILKNFFVDPINIKDERISKLLYKGAQNTLSAMFKVGTPFDPKDHRAGHTPAVIVSAGDVQFPINLLSNVQYNAQTAGVQSLGSTIMKPKAVSASIEVVTESYDGTLLLADLILDFLCINELNLIRDNGAITSFSVAGCSGVQNIAEDQADNAEPLYQASISVQALGTVAWTTNTQGPVFRGAVADVSSMLLPPNV